MALLHVMQQVLDAFGDALALGIDGSLLRVGIEGQEIAWRRGSSPLLNRKLNACLGFGIGLRSLGQAHQGSRVEQINSRCESRYRVVLPSLSGETSVLEFGIGMQTLVP